MKTTRAAERPPIHMLEEEAEKLANLALSIEERLPQVSELLLTEIERAKLHKPGRIAVDVVTMNATVDFLDTGTGAERRVTLVYPPDADIDAGRISILTPVGAGLIGLAAGQSILWPDREGKKRTLQIMRVEQAA